MGRAFERLSFLFVAKILSPVFGFAALPFAQFSRPMACRAGKKLYFLPAQTYPAVLYQKFQPAPHLRPFVECYFVWESAALPAGGISVESPPTGFASMVFNYGEGYRVSTERHRNLDVPTAFLSGQATRSYQLDLSGRIGMAGIVFRPAGLSSLFGLPMYEFADERTALADVLGAETNALAERIAQAFTPEARVAELERFLNARFLKTSPVPDRTDYAANVIVDRFGIVSVGELLDDVCLSRRQFERQFLHRVGVSPKYYARIRRVGYVCAQLAAQRWQVTDWHDLLFRAGYYDQSHFIKDFTEFTGKSPSLYVKGNAELGNFLRT